jgi:uncharacterized glyoxalase superfamily protein PhnB
MDKHNSSNVKARTNLGNNEERYSIEILLYIILAERIRMNQRLVQIALVVNDYDEAIEFYTQQLDFDLIEDTKLSETKRWVVISPKGQNSCALLLAKAAKEEQRTRVGNQTGGRVFLFLHTDNFQRDYNKMLANNIRFVREPAEEPYGTVAVFEDLYGNLWDLIEPKGSNSLLH